MINSFNEIFQDTLYFSFILRIKRKVENTEAKIYLTKFLKNISAVYLYELACFLNQIGVCSKESLFQPNMLPKVYNERQWIKQTTLNSDKMRNKLQAMGIDFEQLVYDINIVVKSSELIDLNFDEYEENNDVIFWNDIFSTIEKIPKIIFGAINVDDEIVNEFYKTLDEEVLKYVDKFEQAFNGERYSYSAYKLFSKNSLLLEDKVLILYRYRSISSIIKVGDILKGVPLNIKLENIFDIYLTNYIRKLKAIVISIVGNDLIKLETNFTKYICKGLEELIDYKDFYKINRKLRNNCHYKDISNLSAEDIKILDIYQDKYLRFLDSNFKDNFFVDIDDECIRMTNFLKACREEGLSKDEIDKDYFKLYYKFYLTGKLN